MSFEFPETAFPPGLYLVATPIGCLSDITLRSVLALQKADLILAENVQTGKNLLSALKISVQAEWTHFTDHQNPQIWVERFQKKPQVYVLISEAGTPGINDPGAWLVSAFRQNSLPVSSLPGPSSISSALSLSGLIRPFTFSGFLPKKKKELQALLQAHDLINGMLLALESPHRLEKTLHFLAEFFPLLQVQIFRELSKKFETHYQGTAAEILSSHDLHLLCKGEMVILLYENKLPNRDTKKSSSQQEEWTPIQETNSSEVAAHDDEQNNDPDDEQEASESFSSNYQNASQKLSLEDISFVLSLLRANLKEKDKAKALAKRWPQFSAKELYQILYTHKA